jgi:hypothetical protein
MQVAPQCVPTGRGPGYNFEELAAGAAPRKDQLLFRESPAIVYIKAPGP